MKIKHTDSRDGITILAVEDERGTHEIELNSIDVENLIGSLRASQEEAIGHPSSRSWAQEGIQRVQYYETPKTLFFRVYVSERVYHEYPIDADTTLASDLKVAADRAEARNASKTTHPQSDGPKGGH